MDIHAVEEPRWVRMAPGEYHELPQISNSRISWRGGQPPLTWRKIKHQLDHPDTERSRAQAYGALMHHILLQPDDPSVLVTDLHRNSNDFRALVEAEGAEYVLKTPEYDEAMRLAEYCRGHPYLGRILDASQALKEQAGLFNIQTEAISKAANVLEVTMGGKIMVDIRIEGVGLFDLKFVRDASYDGFLPQGWTHRYDIQDAWYRRGAHALGAGEESFHFICIEKSEPYDVGTYEWTEGLLWRTEAQIDQILEGYATCHMTEEWPGLPTRSIPVDMPSWWESKVEWQMREGD